MVVAVLVACVAFLGAATSGVFEGVGKGMPGGDPQRAVAAGPTNPQADAEEPSGLNTVAAVVIAGVVAALGGAGLISLLGERRRGGKPEDERSEEPSPVESRLYDFLLAKRQHLLRGMTGEASPIAQSRLEVRYLMTRNPRTIGGMMLRDDVEEMMNRQGVHHVLVVDSDHKLLGVISDRDMKRPAKNAFELMTAEPYSVTPHDLASPAITLMMDRRISCLPVVNGDGVLCGVLTTSDLLVGFQCVLQTLSSVSPSSDSTAGTAATSA